MELVKVLCMSKNEYDLIEDFILYYGRLFGYHNVIIIDNESTHPHVLDVYSKYIPLGVTVHHEPNYTGDGQGCAFTKYMRLHKADCSFMIGLDTDEFLYSTIAPPDGSTLSVIECILSAFRNYASEYTKFKFDAYPYSVVDVSSPHYVEQKMTHPTRSIVHFSDWQNSPEKYFCRSDAFVSTTNGNHHVNVAYGRTTGSSLGLFHFHSTGKRREYERARTVMDGYRYIDTSTDVSTQIDYLNENSHWMGNGCHRVDSYRRFLLRMYLVQLFLTYIKRLPTEDELACHVSDKLHQKMSSRTMEQTFQNCDECLANVDVSCPYTYEDASSLVFCDLPFDKMPSDCKRYTFVSRLLETTFQVQGVCSPTPPSEDSV